MGKTSKIFLSMLLGMCILVFICGCGKSTADYVESENVSGVDTGITDTESILEKESVSIEDTSIKDTPIEDASKVESVYVYVCGAVKKPGVYVLDVGSRIFDLFAKAGGLKEDAATDYWNQAKVLVDGEMIYVPTCQEVEERGEDSWSSTGASIMEEPFHDEDKTDKVNINTASKEVLMTLPGIGEAKALAILSYRKEHGGFSKIEDLMEIEGIKEGVYAKIKDYIMVD